MVTINKQTLQAYKQLYNGSSPHDPTFTYPANTHVRDAVGNIYVSVQEVVGSNDPNDQILISNADYWYQASGTAEAGVDLDAVLSDSGVSNGSIIAFNATSGTLESFTIPMFSEYYINSSGGRDSRQAAAVDPNSIGFSELPKPSTFNKTSYVAYESGSGGSRHPTAHNTTMDLAVDAQGYMVSGYGISNDARVLLINPSYYRMTMAANFEQSIQNRDAKVSRITSFAGRYAILLDNGSFYSRITRQRAPQEMYSASWFGQDSMDLDTALGGTDYIVLDVEQAANCYVLLYRNTTDNSYRMISFRFHVDGTTVTTLREVTLAGNRQPSQFGFIEYPQVPADTLDPRIFAVQDDMLVYTTAGNTLTTAVACNRVYPYTHEKFYISAGTSATFLTTFENDTYSSTDTGIAIPNATTSFRDSTVNGFVAVFDETLYVEGSNPNGELGTAGTASTTGSTVTIYSTAQGAGFQLKDCMFCHLGSARGVIVWSDKEAFISGFSGANYSQLGNFMHDEAVNGFDFNGPTRNSTTFRRVFNTDDGIKDCYVHNQSQSRPLEPILIFLLENGTAYGKGTTLLTGTGRGSGSPYWLNTSITDPGWSYVNDRTVDYYNISYKRIAI